MYYHKYMFDGPEIQNLLAKTGFKVDVKTIESGGISDGLIQPGFQIIVARKPDNSIEPAS